MNTLLIVIGVLNLILLGAGVYLLLSLRRSVTQANLGQTIDNEEIQTLLQEMSTRYSQQYSDIITELVSYKENVETLKDEVSDEMYEAAKEVVIEAGKASTSFIQRKLGVGYSRAAKLIDMLEDNEVIGPADGSSPRLVLVEELNDEENKNYFNKSTEALYEDAKKVVIEAGKASTSYIQRKLGIGYSRAAEIMEMLEQKEVIGPANGSKPRVVIIQAEEDVAG